METNFRPNANTIQRTLFPNGIVLLTYQKTNDRTVDVEGAVWAGSADLPAEQAGLANFVASGLMRGTQTRPFDTIYAELEGVGASLGFSSGYQLSDFSAESLPEDFDLLLEIIADTLRNPSFPEQEIEKLRNEAITGLQMQQNNSASMASKQFRQKLFEDHPYGIPISGTIETVSQFQAAELSAFHSKHYAPNGMLFVVVSNLGQDLIVEKVTASFGDWQNRSYEKQMPIPGKNRPKGITTVKHPMPAKSQSDIVMGLPGPLRLNPDYNAIRMANTILGVFGMMGRLGKSVREREGLAYYVSSSLSGGWGPSPWTVRTGVAPEKVELAIELIGAEIRRMQDQPVSAEELADSKAFLTGSLPMSIETSAGIASTIFQIEFLQLGLDYLDRYKDMINSVTIDQVQAAAQTYFSAQDLVISIAGPWYDCIEVNAN